MRAVIDTSSLIALVKYYLPFDNGKLKDLIQQKFESGELILIDKVLIESKGIAKGLIVSELEFILEVEKVNTEGLIPNSAFLNQLNNQFCDQRVKRLKAINDAEFEAAKSDFQKSTDCRILLFASKNRAEDFLVITEETTASNDNKLFKKIPACCDLIGVKHCAFPVYLRDYLQLNLGRLIAE